MPGPAAPAPAASAPYPGLEPGRDTFGFNAEAEINREDYGLVWNAVLDSGGFLVGKEVRIELGGEAIRQS